MFHEISFVGYVNLQQGVISRNPNPNPNPNPHQVLLWIMYVLISALTTYKYITPPF